MESCCLRWRFLSVAWSPKNYANESHSVRNSRVSSKISLCINTNYFLTLIDIHKILSRLYPYRKPCSHCSSTGPTRNLELVLQTDVAHSEAIVPGNRKHETIHSPCIRRHSVLSMQNGKILLDLLMAATHFDDDHEQMRNATLPVMTLRNFGPHLIK